MPASREEAAAQYRNLGRKHWLAYRAAWTAKTPEQRQASPKKARPLEVDGIVNSVIQSTGDLPHPVALPQMIDLLVDVWEADGLFDA